MKYAEKLAPFAALSTALALGGCGLYRTADAPSAVMTANAPDMEASMAQLGNFWAAKGVSGAAGVKLLTIASGTIVCKNLDGKPTEFSADEGPAAWCNPSTIVVSAPGMQRVGDMAISNDHPAADAELGVLAHEYGHDVQHVTGDRYAKTLRNEQNADCLAGEAVAAIRPAALQAAEFVYYLYGGDSNHGTADERAAQMQAGADTDGIACVVKR